MTNPMDLATEHQIMNLNLTNLQLHLMTIVLVSVDSMMDSVVDFQNRVMIRLHQIQRAHKIHLAIKRLILVLMM